jgi:diguanylate cyclase (GGDEF)-like protein
MTRLPRRSMSEWGSLASHRELLGRTATVQRSHQALEALIALAFTDPTTKLHNRRALDEISSLSLDFDGPSFGVLMLDLTGFKRVNDEGGHSAGDAALGQVGNTLAERCRTDLPSPLGLPFRYGGDEFCILVPGSGFDSFTESANLAGFNWQTFTLEGKALGFGASIGYSAPDDEVSLSILIDRADAAAKVSKHRHDEPTKWSPTLEYLEDLYTARRRCEMCAATISVQIPQKNLRAGFLLSCAHCHERFPDSH